MANLRRSAAAQMRDPWTPILTAAAVLLAAIGIACASNGAGTTDGAGGATGSGGSSNGGSSSGGASGVGGQTGAGTSSGAGVGGAAGSAGGAGTTGSAGGMNGGGHGGAGGAAGAGAGGQTGGLGGRTGTLRIMPLGDSTTASICYRSYLWQMLTGAGHTQFDFVGTRKGDPGCTFTAYDQDNEGHGGYVVSDLLKAAGSGVRPGGADTTDPFVSDSRDLVTWFDGHPADIAIMHFGTNDVWNSAPITTQRIQTILMAYSAILTRLRANNPNVRLLVAQITPLNPSGCTPCTANARALDDMIPGWAAANTSPTSPISVVDQFTGFDPATDTRDGVHSNNSGSMKIATNWFNALAPLF